MARIGAGRGIKQVRKVASKSQIVSNQHLILIQEKALKRDKNLTPLCNQRSSNYVLNMHSHWISILVVLNEEVGFNLTKPNNNDFKFNSCGTNVEAA